MKIQNIWKAGILAWDDGEAICIYENGKVRSPDEAWKVCEFVESHGVKALPMWFHGLDALERNVVTPEQAQGGWNDYERRRIMQWYYQHKQAVAA